MAVHGKPEPPRTLAAWHRFQEECWRQQRYDWLPKPDTLGIPWIVWSALAEDHPFKGSRWCWRCVAEAIGSPVGASTHISTNGTICWGKTEGDPGTEDRQQDTRPPGDESTSDWTEAGRQFVREGLTAGGLIEAGRTYGVDTGTIFYTPPPKPPASAGRQVVEGRSVRITRLDSQGRPVGPTQDLIADAGSFVFSEEARCNCGSCPADAESLPGFPQWPPPPVEIPLSPDEVIAAIAALDEATETPES